MQLKMIRNEMRRLGQWPRGAKARIFICFRGTIERRALPETDS